MVLTVLHVLMSTKLFFHMFPSFPPCFLYSEGRINDFQFSGVCHIFLIKTYYLQ